MSQWAELGPGDLAALTVLCARSVVDAPSEAELAAALFDPGQPALVLGDPAVGVVAVVTCEDGPHVRVLAVDPAVRRQGHGSSLLRAAEEWARSAGQTSLQTGADPPYFLWPGVPGTETAVLCLMEKHHYARVATNFNMRVDLSSLPDDPGGHELAGAPARDEIDAWMTTHWSNWRPEALRALDKGNLVVSREAGGGEVVAICAFEVNRAGLLGPVAVRPDLMGQGRGRAALIGALHELRRRGRDEVSVVWVGPVVPYARVGGRVSDVFFVYRKELR